jgi:hypothetical protein
MKTKRFLLTVAAMAAMTLTACGGGAGGGSWKLTENEIFGKFPSIYQEYGKAEKEIDAEERASSGKADPDGKRAAGFTEKLDKITAKAVELGTAELAVIDGRAVPFKFNYDDDRFDVESATVSAAKSETSNRGRSYGAGTTLAIELKIKTKRDLDAIPGMLRNVSTKDMYCLMFNNAGECIYKAELSPMGLKSRMAAGTDCTSILKISCTSHDLTDFKEIAFADEEQYRSWEDTK